MSAFHPITDLAADCGQFISGLAAIDPIADILPLRHPVAMRMAPVLLIIALAAASCQAELGQQAETAKPQIPEALHGCWELREPASEEYPDGLSSTLTIEADRIVIEADGVPRRVGTIEEVERVNARLIDGRISAKEGRQLITLATSLELDPQGAPPGTLMLHEGDAGSYDYRRCGGSRAGFNRLLP